MRQVASFTYSVTYQVLRASWTIGLACLCIVTGCSNANDNFNLQDDRGEASDGGGLRYDGWPDMLANDLSARVDAGQDAAREVGNSASDLSADLADGAAPDLADGAAPDRSNGTDGEPDGPLEDSSLQSDSAEDSGRDGQPTSDLSLDARDGGDASQSCPFQPVSRICESDQPTIGQGVFAIGGADLYYSDRRNWCYFGCWEGARNCFIDSTGIRSTAGLRSFDCLPPSMGCGVPCCGIDGRWNPNDRRCEYRNCELSPPSAVCTGTAPRLRQGNFAIGEKLYYSNGGRWCHFECLVGKEHCFVELTGADLDDLGDIDGFDCLPPSMGCGSICCPVGKSWDASGNRCQ